MTSPLRALLLGPVLLLAHSAWAAPLAAPDVRPPIEQYRGATIVKLGECHYTRVLAQRNAQMGLPPTDESDYQACAAALRSAAPGALKQVLKVSTRKPLRQAIQAFHASFLTSLDGLPQLKGESDEDYQIRQLALGNALSTAWDDVENNR